MARQYTPRLVLRHVSNALLKRYFDERRLLAEIDFPSLPETKVDPIYAAVQCLIPEDQARVGSDLFLVHSLADEQGLRAILDEAAYHGLDLVTDLDELEGFYDKALWTLLEHPTIIVVASRFSDADHLPNAYWHRRRDGVPVSEARDNELATAALAEAIASFYRANEGRGSSCEVEVYRRGSGWYFIALPEDYARTSLEYVGGALERRPQRPAFEVVFVYDPERPALDTYAQGQKKTRLELETIFGRTILGGEINPTKSDKIYDLNKLKRRGLRFIYGSDAGIAEVRVRSLRFSLFGTRRRLTFEADPGESKDAIYDFVDAAFGEPGNGQSNQLSLATANVTRVGIQVTYLAGSRRRRPTKTFYLTYPDGCTLGQEGREAVLRQMLIDSKIETTKAPESVAAG
jgi:hypothetical protein